jgi:hypothetical protein
LEPLEREEDGREALLLEMLMELWQVGRKMAIENCYVVGKERTAVDEKQSVEVAVLQCVHAKSEDLRFIEGW